MKGPTSGLSQQVGEAEGSLILGAQGRVGAALDDDGTERHCQTVRVRQARREGVRVQEPVVEPPQAMNQLEPGGYGLGSSAHRLLWLKEEVTPHPVLCSGTEATRKACGVLVARLQGNSWTPTPPTGAP